jgi:5-methyltetrahydrofolate corrinoid/iron sulfur protein methyltransferase
MKIIGESLNVMSKVIGQAMKDRDPGPIQAMAKSQAEAGVDWIDINLGPAKKGGPELMQWVVQTTQEAVPDVPLSLDTSNIEAIEAGLEVCKQQALINSIMARPERYEKMIPIAAKHKAQVIALLWGPEGLPRDENERAALCVELTYALNEAGVANEDIFVDGITTPVNIQQPQLMSLLTFQAMLQDIAPGAKSTNGLSNCSNGSPDHLRPILNQTYMVMLERSGMYSCIADHEDDKIMAIARGERPEIVEVIHQVMDGQDPAPDSKELMDYVKTAKVLMGHSLYSDSWLEL